MNTVANGVRLDAGGAAPAKGDAIAAPHDSMAAWLGSLCESIHAALSGVAVLGPPDAGPYAPVAFWPARQDGAPKLADLAERALEERRTAMAVLPPLPDAVRGAPVSRGLAFPIIVDGRLHGVVALEFVERADAEIQSVMQRVQQGLAWVEGWLRREQQHALSTEERLMAVLDLLGAVLEEERFEPACRSLATELATRLDCDRVSVGVVRGGHAEVVALSHSAQIGRRMNLMHAVGAAMDEAIDQKAVIRYPLAENEIVVVRDHERLANEHGSGSVLTVPLAGSGTLSGAITFERPARMPFEPAEVELAQSVAAVVARVLELKKLNERALLLRVKDAAAEQLRRLTGPRHFKAKLVIAIAVLAAVFFSFATAEFRVTAPATLEGAVRRTLAAPFDGYIATAPSRAGDVVRTGAVLATLDDREIRLERLKWASQHGQFLKQQQEAVANRDRAKAQIMQAQFEQAQAQISLLDEQITRATVKAPFDGIIVKGDLSQSLGSVVKRGDVLFEITPLESYRVIVNVDERDIADVATGQKGILVLASIARESFPFTVTNVTSVTTARDGRNFFRVEGMIDGVNDRLRPGMEGVGKIGIEERHVIWIWTYRLVNWLRLFAWTYWP